MQLLDRSVSRKHALLRYAGEAWYIQDQGSAGGTFVNGQQITARQLKSGYRISIGEMTFFFQVDGRE
jgi:pSer/pThr/pTyr-binding forkhead associated (FHA) protein